MRAWIDKHQGKYNIYTSVNRARDDAPKNVRLRGDNKKKNQPSTVGWIRAIVADIDPTKIKGGDPSGENFRKERERLQSVLQQLDDEPICPPTAIVDTGGGLHVWWQLWPRIPATPENVALAEGVGRTPAKRYGGDSVFDVARIMRVPGTVDIPTTVKVAQGRTAALANILEQSSCETYALEKLAAWARLRWKRPVEVTDRLGRGGSRDLR